MATAGRLAALFIALLTAHSSSLGRAQRAVAPLNPWTSDSNDGAVEIPRIVWCSWLQGEDDLMGVKSNTERIKEGKRVSQAGTEKMKALNRIAYLAWQKMNPEWQVKLISIDNVRQYLPDIAPHDNRIHLQFYTDLIRVRLLELYGGVWVDMSLVPMKPLTHWLPDLVQQGSGFFAYWIMSPPLTRRAFKKFPPEVPRHLLLDNWFLAARPGHPISQAWAEAMEVRYLQGPENVDYFQGYHELANVFRTNETVFEEVKKIPQVSAHLPVEYLLQQSRHPKHNTREWKCSTAQLMSGTGTVLCPLPQRYAVYHPVYKRPRLDVDVYNDYLTWVAETSAQSCPPYSMMALSPCSKG